MVEGNEHARNVACEQSLMFPLKFPTSTAIRTLYMDTTRKQIDKFLLLVFGFGIISLTVVINQNVNLFVIHQSEEETP